MWDLRTDRDPAGGSDGGYADAMVFARRISAGAVLTGLAMVFLTGCLNVELVTAVSAQGTFSGTSVMTFDKASVQEFGITDLSQAQTQLGVPDSVTDKVTVSWNQTDQSYIQTVSYTDATPAEIEAATSATTTADDSAGTTSSTTSFGFPLVAAARGDQMVVSLSEQAVDAGRDSAPVPDSDPQMREELAEMLFGDSAVEVTMTMPGSIESVRGVIPDAAQRKGAEIEVAHDDRTLRLSAPFAALVALEETAQEQPGLVVRSQNDGVTAAAPTPQPSPSAAVAAEPASGPAGATAAIALGAAALVAVVAVVVLLLRRRRQKP